MSHVITRCCPACTTAMQGDVLSNLNIDDVAKIMGGNVGAAMAFVATVKVGQRVAYRKP